MDDLMICSPLLPPRTAKCARELSSERIVVENTIAELKHFKVLVDAFRHSVDIYDDVLRSVVAIVNPRIIRRVAVTATL
jgi:hypothetical protein